MADRDQDIVQSVLSGDTERYAELVDRAKDSVYGVLRRLAANPETAEDLAQTAFLKAFENLAGFRGEASFTTWATGIAIHLARDAHRRRQRAEVIPLDVLAEGGSELGAAELAAGRSDPFEDLVESELGDRLAHALAGLPSEYREVFVLRHIEDKPYEEIAALTGASVGALKVRNHRARKLLLEELRAQDAPRTSNRRMS